MARDLSQPVKPMLYQVVSAEKCIYEKGQNVGETYYKAVAMPQFINRANCNEKNTFLISDEYSINRIEAYLAAREAGKPTAEWNGLFVNIGASLQTVKFDQMFHLRYPTDPTKFGKPRSSMNILIFLKEDNTLSEDPEDAARRFIERAGEWITSAGPASGGIAPQISNDIPDEEEEWLDVPGMPGKQVNPKTSEMRDKQ